jgi:hypothetical protein
MAEFESSFNANFNVFMMPSTTNGSYPLSAYVYTTISMTEMTDCIRAKELVQWLWWSISSTRGRHLAELNSSTSLPLLCAWLLLVLTQAWVLAVQSSYRSRARSDGF